jgi:hypothetical protein
MPPANDEGKLRKDAGQALALSGQTGDEFKDWVYASFPRFAEFVRECGNAGFLLEDFRYWARCQPDFIEPRSHQAWGAVATVLTKRGLIVASGRYVAAKSPRTHSHPVREWLVA